MKQTTLSVTEDKIILKINKAELLPAYAHYLFNYYNLDYNNKLIVFADTTCKLVKEKGEYRWQDASYI